MSTTDERQRERISLDLIEFVSRHTIDDDYEMVARRRAQTREHRRGRVRRTSTVGVLAAMAAFGALLAVAASQTTRGAGADEANRAQLISQIESRREQLDGRRAEITRLQAQGADLQADLLSGTDARTGVLGRLRAMSVRTGAAAVTGPGVRVVVDDKPGADDPLEEVLDADLQRLVNGLWTAGAEAVSVNGIRLTTLSPIRKAGNAITVDFRSVSPPYTVVAIGDPETLPARFAESTSGAGWYQLQRDPGLRFEMRVVDSLSMQASTSLTLTHAEPLGGRRPQQSEEPTP